MCKTKQLQYIQSERRRSIRKSGINFASLEKWMIARLVLIEKSNLDKQFLSHKNVIIKNLAFLLL